MTGFNIIIESNKTRSTTRIASNMTRPKIRLVKRSVDGDWMTWLIDGMDHEPDWMTW